MSKDSQLRNFKPYRTKELKKLAKADAKKGKDGAFRSNVPVLRHKDGIVQRGNDQQRRDSR